MANVIPSPNDLTTSWLTSAGITTPSADTMQEASGGGAVQVALRVNVTAPAGDKIYSCEAQLGAGTRFLMLRPSGSCTALFDLQNETVTDTRAEGGVTNLTASIGTADVNGWIPCQILYTEASVSGFAKLGMSDVSTIAATSNNTPLHVPDGTSSIQVRNIVLDNAPVNQTVNLGQAGSQESATAITSETVGVAAGAVDGFSATNYLEIADDPSFTFPNGDWSRIVIARPDDIVGGEDITSNAEYGIANSFNFYILDDQFGMKFNALSDLNAGSLTSGNWYLVCGQRSGTTLSLRVLPMGSTVIDEDNSTTVNEGSNSGNSIYLGRRRDNGLNPFNGALSDFLIINNTISDSDLQAISTGTPLDSFAWNSDVDLWVIADTQTGLDQTGNHTVIENGALNATTQPAQLVRFSAGDNTIGQSVSNTASFGVTFLKSSTVDQSISNDTSNSVSTFRSLGVGQSESNSIAQVITYPAGPQTMGQALSQDSGTDFSLSKQEDLQTSETNNSATNVGVIVGIVNIEQSFSQGSATQLISEKNISVQTVLEQNSSFTASFFKSGAPLIIVPTNVASNLFIIPENNVDSATMSASSTAAGFDVDNLKNNDKGKGWRSPGLSSETITSTWGNSQSFSAAAIAFSNLNAGSTVEFRYFTNSADVNPVFTTGQLTVKYSYGPPLGFSTIGITSYAFGGGTYFSTLFETVSAQKMEVVISSPSNSDGYFELSKLISGHAVTPGRGASLNARIGMDDSSELRRLTSGSVATTIRPRNKRLDFSLNHLDPEDKLTLMQIHKSNSIVRPVFISADRHNINPEIESSYMIFGYFQQVPDQVNFNPNKFIEDISIVEA